MPNQHLVIMVKAPRMGNVKTRLAKEIGSVAATAFYRRTTNHIIRRLYRDPRWHTYIAIAPDTALNQPFWPNSSAPSAPRLKKANPKRTKQGPGDLGQRMQMQFNQINKGTYAAKGKNSYKGNSANNGALLIIGTDIPQIGANHIAKAFKQLQQHSALIGPSGDGGYWIIGQRRTPKIHALFKNIRWSTEHTLHDTMNNLPFENWCKAEQLCDVDTREDYLKLNQHSRKII